MANELAQRIEKEYAKDRPGSKKTLTALFMNRIVWWLAIGFGVTLAITGYLAFGLAPDASPPAAKTLFYIFLAMLLGILVLTGIATALRGKTFVNK